MRHPRKSVKIVESNFKATPDENLRKRISDFRDNQRRRMSEQLQSSKKRTLFQSRKYVMKSNSEDHTCEE